MISSATPLKKTEVHNDRIFFMVLKKPNIIALSQIENTIKGSRHITFKDCNQETPSWIQFSFIYVPPVHNKSVSRCLNWQETRSSATNSCFIICFPGEHSGGSAGGDGCLSDWGKPSRNWAGEPQSLWVLVIYGIWQMSCLFIQASCFQEEDELLEWWNTVKG